MERQWREVAVAAFRRASVVEQRGEWLRGRANGAVPCTGSSRECDGRDSWTDLAVSFGDGLYSDRWVG